MARTAAHASTRSGPLAALIFAAPIFAALILAGLMVAGPARAADPQPTTQGTPQPTAPPAAAQKVLRFAFPIAETGFDPAQVSDLYSRTVTAGIFEAPLGFDFLARPFRMKPILLSALPEISADFKRFTFRVKPGIFFADDAAFKGVRRELTAQDFVYSLKRHYDPSLKSPNLYRLENAKIVGLSELRKKAMDAKQPFPYDTEVEGLRALDRHSFQIVLAEPSPRFHQSELTDAGAFGVVAREVVEFYGDRIMEHPVGTGPFRLAEWRRSSRIVLERNPGYRELYYDEQPPADDPRSQAIAQALKGRRMPMLDRVEISIIDESQPRWLSFLNGQIDYLALPNEFADLAAPNGRIAPHLARKGIQLDQSPLVDVLLASLFNHENPVVGGYTPEKVALRRAISLGYDSAEAIRLVYKGLAVRGQGPIAPLSFGYDPAFKSEMGDFDVPRAKALLDLHGYTDRNRDGWREQPDGSPLVLEYATQPDQASRQLVELWQKNMKTIGLKMVFKPAKWPENLKASRAGKLMMWGVGWSATSPDGDTFLALGYGPNKGGANHARFDLAAFNELYIKQNKMPDGPERQAVMQDAARLMVAYAPYKITGHRISNDLTQPWVQGYRRNPFVREFYIYLDVDADMRRKALP